MSSTVVVSSLSLSSSLTWLGSSPALPFCQEWLTGGAIQAGYHEVVCTRETVEARDAARAAGRSTWRVSSTVFSQLASDELLRVLDGFAEENAAGDAEEKYPAMPVGQFVESELRFINLATTASESVDDRQET